MRVSPFNARGGGAACPSALELAFQNALEGCGTEEVTAAKLHARIMEGEEAQKKFIGL
jgi:hypothetical protein